MQMSWEGSEPVVRDVQLLQQVAAGQALCGVDKGGKWDDKIRHAGKAKIGATNLGNCTQAKSYHSMMRCRDKPGLQYTMQLSISAYGKHMAMAHNT